MSRFFSDKHSSLEAYVPGEQPRDRSYIKLNTNESPFPPSQSVLKAVADEADTLNLYSDPTAAGLKAALAETYGVLPENICCSNGSDEALSFIFIAYGDDRNGFVFPDLTYGFYPVFAKLYGVPFDEIPLKDDFTVDVNDYISVGKNVIIANPNAPTGIALGLDDIRKIAESNSDNVVVIDEAYVDFGGESAIPLIYEYENLIVVCTFSKSRSLAGGRLGFAIASSEIIRDIETIRNSINPYNVNRLTMAAGIAALRDAPYYVENCKKIIETREKTAKRLAEAGFDVLPSKSNFLFAKANWISGGRLYEELKKRGVLVRHFSKARIADYVRITIGSDDEMDGFFKALEDVKNENC